MKPAPECYECLQRLIRQAAQLATDDASLREQIVERAAGILKDEFSYDDLCLIVASRIHRVAKELSGNPDPYRGMKEREMALAEELFPQLLSQIESGAGRHSEQGGGRGDGLRSCLEMAAAANAIDYFRDIDAVKRDMSSPVSFAVDDSAHLEGKLMAADRVLYLADNVGELLFDLALVRRMREFAHVTYAVKPEAVQNDVTLDDVRQSGLDGEFGEVISTGVASPGVVFSLASPEFRREFDSADLVFAKGMGHYESLSELPAEGRFFLCLRAKCGPVARSIGVPLNSYVAMLR